MNQKGFTLIELVLVIALIIITVGISTDIIISLVSSYNKSQITNQIEQTANFVFMKMEKELRNAASVDPLPPAGSKTLVFRDTNNNVITYALGTDGILRRNTVPLSSTGSTTGVGGITISCLGGGGACFSNIGTGSVDVIKIQLVFEQASSSNRKAYTGSVKIDSAVVVRSSY